MKKILLILLTLNVLLLSGCVSETEEHIDYSNTYEYEEISLTDPISGETVNGVSIIRYLGNDNLVKIPEQIDNKIVIRVNKDLFTRDYTTKNLDVEVIEIPMTVIDIGNGDFAHGAPNLTSIIIHKDNPYILSHRNGIYQRISNGLILLDVSIGDNLTYYVHKDTVELGMNFNNSEKIHVLVFEEGVEINEMSPLIYSVSFNTITEIKVHENDYQNFINFLDSSDSIVDVELLKLLITSYGEE